MIGFLRGYWVGRLCDALPTFSSICFLDVGAAGGLPDRFKPLMSKINYIAIEPDERSIGSVSSGSETYASTTYITSVLSAECTTTQLHLTRKPTCSSLLVPNTNLLGLFPEQDRFDIISSSSVPSTTADIAFADRKIDFMKLDVQGSEFQVLQGSARSLKNILALEIEVEFHELYLGQKLFGDLCKLLESEGFTFVDFTNIQRWDRQKLSVGCGQAVFGDALFIKEFKSVKEANFTEDMLERYFLILALYHRYDIIRDSMSRLNEESQKSFRKFLNVLAVSEFIFRAYILTARVIGRIIRIFFPNSKIHVLY